MLFKVLCCNMTCDISQGPVLNNGGITMMRIIEEILLYRENLSAITDAILVGEVSSKTQWVISVGVKRNILRSFIQGPKQNFSFHVFYLANIDLKVRKNILYTNSLKSFHNLLWSLPEGILWLSWMWLSFNSNHLTLLQTEFFSPQNLIHQKLKEFWLVSQRGQIWRC